MKRWEVNNVKSTISKSCQGTWTHCFEVKVFSYIQSQEAKFTVYLKKCFLTLKILMNFYIKIYKYCYSSFRLPAQPSLANCEMNIVTREHKGTRELKMFLSALL